ncbi:immunity 52 family protein [Rhodovulum sulfidophilum]|uniref:Imm52 family immunity protein n=1 Tax=Rhodovulum sulfidophilum TaxID=35806 RepID=UPI001920F415|nr:Imm52 family immunity protein [Rhodovulum sulfidophilum]MBL3576373.1 immunity 52 family protein [Rhodovulum sulfidophilum]MCE8433810.1 immunity 52 family protein [Rhodovulum sulfidophilum]MCF4118923.1 immunity 52 family protein [Rhodovulum sulfidophilum]
MYSINGFFKRSQNLAYDAITARAEYGRILTLASILKRYNSDFADFAFNNEDAQRRYAEIGDEILKTDEPSSDLLAELEILGSQKTIPVEGNEDQHFKTIWETNQSINSKYGSRLLFIELKGHQTYAAKIQVTIDFQSARFGGVEINLPMKGDTDFWYQHWTTMRDIMFAAMEIWEFDWIVAQPTMYVGLQKNLFVDRRSFGWMGWTPQDLPRGVNSALARMEPHKSGTFMLLQERMMNMKAPDIEACNKAEAYLLDHGALALL